MVVRNILLSFSKLITGIIVLIIKFGPRMERAASFPRSYGYSG